MQSPSMTGRALTGPSRATRIVRRTAGAGLSIAAALLVYAVAKWAGVDIETIRRSERPADLPALYVVIVGAIFALLGWGLLAALERWVTTRARLIWTLAGKLVLLGAVLHSALESQLDAGQRVVLVLMTVAYAAVLISVLLGTSPAPSLRRSAGD